MTRSAKHSCQRRIRLLPLLLLFACRGAALAQPAGRLTIEPGETVERVFGPVTFLIHVSEKLAQIRVEVELSGRLIGEHNLAPSDDTFRMDLLEGGTAVRGTLLAKFGYPQQDSSLSGDFTVTDGDRQVPFRGEIAIWEWPVPVVSRHWNVWLTPELNAEVDLMRTASQNVEIQFMTAGQIILSVTLSQGANRAVATQGYEVATVRIRPGMVMHLQPATPVQNGEVFLRGVFSSTNHPRVKFKGALATWQYVPPVASAENSTGANSRGKDPQE
jgi:hypothetical protein